MAAPHASANVDVIVGIESRGFIFGAALADRLGAGFSPVRKPGKLPSTTRRVDYDLEYGSDALEAHDDAVDKGQRVLIVDDLLATGGTAAATVRLVRELGGEVVGVQFLIELVALNGRERLAGEQVSAVLQY
jgi:adenine phosphoribosyltransferase